MNIKVINMLNIDRALKCNRVMKALTGVSIDEFYELLPIFTALLLIAQLERKPNRQRALGAGKKGRLASPAHKLFFILCYYKVYPTNDVAGVIFDVSRSKPCEWVKKFTPIVEKCLGRVAVLPKRNINTVAEFMQMLPTTNDIFIDGTERQVQRSATSKSRTYSGKKKLHSRKNLIVCDESRKILVVSKTKNGKIHDKKMLDKTGLLNAVPKHVAIWVDKGFRGIEKSCTSKVMIPKYNQKKPLTDAEKLENKAVSSIRMVVEHAIGGIKRFGIMKDVFRGKNGSDDQFTSICAGLWNFHLRYV
jgi:hypothetical protein